jgi:hypothetical protein
MPRRGGEACISWAGFGMFKRNPVAGQNPSTVAERRAGDAPVMHSPLLEWESPAFAGPSGSRSVSGILSGAAIHLGRPSPAGSLPPTWSSAGRVIAPIGVAPGGACLAAPVSGDAGGLLHHRFTLASAFTCDAGGRSPLCCAIQRVSPSGSYPAPSPCGVPTFLDACAPRLPDRHEKSTGRWSPRSRRSRHRRPGSGGRAA